MRTGKLVLLSLALSLALPVLGAGVKKSKIDSATKHTKPKYRAVQRKANKKKNYSLLADYQPDAAGGHGKHQAFSRRLASGNPDADLDHYHNMTRRLGVDLGAWLPMGDFNNIATFSPMIGVHFIWEAIPPFGFTVSYRRASSDNKNSPGTTKVSVNQISIGTQASFPSGRFIPFVKVEGAFYFNDVRQNNTTSTGDTDFLTTFGISAGLGFDFVVGREVSIGLDAMYHYPIPKQVSISGANFNLGSPFATFAFRLNF